VVVPGRDTTDSIAALDSATLADAFRLDSALAAPPPASSREPASERPTAAVPPRDTAPRQARAYLVSFATLVSEQGALAMASGIEVEGRRARVISATRAGGTIYRVILGPFSSRPDAERAGRASGRSYWIFEDAP
jgi:cell division septation protein DedD